jgi:hypothetical protein
MTVIRGVVLVACALALCACGSSGHKAASVVARKAETGKHASVTASYKFSALKDLSVHVEATPAQRVKGGWVVSCGEGLYVMTRDSADFAGRTPLNVPVRGNYTPQTQLTCEFVAAVTLARSGHLKVELHGRHSF